MVKATKDYATGYSSVDPEMLCQKCAHGRVSEGRQGRTEVVCGAQQFPRPIQFVVSKCSDYARRRGHLPQFVAPPIILAFERGVLMRYDETKAEWTPVTPGTPSPEQFAQQSASTGRVQ